MGWFVTRHLLPCCRPPLLAPAHCPARSSLPLTVAESVHRQALSPLAFPASATVHACGVLWLLVNPLCPFTPKRPRPPVSAHLNGCHATHPIVAHCKSVFVMTSSPQESSAGCPSITSFTVFSKSFCQLNARSAGASMRVLALGLLVCLALEAGNVRGQPAQANAEAEAQASAGPPVGQPLQQNVTLPPLPYPTTAMAPAIGNETMTLHWTK